LSWFGPEVSGERAYLRRRIALDGLLPHLRWSSRRELSTACLICWRTGSQLGHCGIRLQRRKNQVLVRLRLQVRRSLHLRVMTIRTSMTLALRTMSSGS
jgi:hypothetical protein